MSTIIERVNSFEDACEVLNRETTLPDFSMIPEKDRKPLIAHYKLIVICEALNEGHIHDWNNGEWDKWYPWFYMRSSSSSVGSRSTAPIICARLRFAALAFASSLKNWQTMQGHSLKSCTKITS